MAEHEVRVRMSDGVELAVSLYLPETDEPQPCLLEALPYRKDDLTSSYAESYRALRDTYGYAVARVDLRGTGSSGGDATDEYPATELDDLSTVIAWLAEQEWCDGGVAMFGTSYSGFNSLQLAAHRPPALKAICAIYASDDRWADDVHWRGDALKLTDLVDYDHYMTPMCLLPPAPPTWQGEDEDDWRAEWRRRWETNEPWLLTWLREDRDGPYWQAGSVRHLGYDRIQCPTLIIAGWADGYRNSTFRTVAGLGAAGTPWRLLAGPWAHADPTTAMPGPRIDLDTEMASWFDRWLRGTAQEEWVDRADLFVRTSTVPEIDLDTHEGYWVSGPWPPAEPSTTTLDLDGPRSLRVEPDVGTAAWIDCAGHLPWGLSGDQRDDDARSLTWDLDVQPEIVGQPSVTLRLGADAPQASVSVKLCDVFPDGTSALITRGTVALGPVPEEITVVLDACAYRPDPGHRLRVSVAGADWPNTIAPPAPLTLTVHGGRLTLPLWSGGVEPPTFTPGAEHSAESAEGVEWSITRDVLRRTTTARVDSGATYDTPAGGTASERYTGEVGVDRRTFDQWAEATTRFALTWPGIEVEVVSTLRVDITAEAYDVVIDADAYDGGELVGHREWRERFARRSGSRAAQPCPVAAAIAKTTNQIAATAKPTTVQT